MRYVPGGAEIQVGVTTFAGRSHTEIARLIAFDHGWKLYGDQIIEQNEVVVTDTHEELARSALSLGWYDPTGALSKIHVQPAIGQAGRIGHRERAACAGSCSGGSQDQPAGHLVRRRLPLGQRVR
jgi:hypothetical protein